MISRIASKRILNLAKQFRSVAVVGPRQSGKTTLVQSLFPSRPYVNFELPDNRGFFEDDPRQFIDQYREGAIFDEAQHVPSLFSYLQDDIDKSDKRGRFILTGSNNFLLNEKISQSLAGRVAYCELLPLSLKELSAGGFRFDCHELMLRGFYPELHKERIGIREWFAAYTQTYLERDVRLLMNIEKTRSFSRFLSLCAGRTGQLLNISSIAIEAGVDHTTIGRWLGILQSSYVVFLLQPHHRNFNKRIVKTSKLYFYDTGLACHLLNIHSRDALLNSPFRGALFENMIISELKKNRFNMGTDQNIFFWRDNTGNELDVLIENPGGSIVPVEIKAGVTVTDSFFKGLNFWKKIASRAGKEKALVFYMGKERQQRSDFLVEPWGNVADY